jgi:hypothetical protein
MMHFCATSFTTIDAVWNMFHVMRAATTLPLRRGNLASAAEATLVLLGCLKCIPFCMRFE